jgi:hypothetical protein
VTDDTPTKCARAGCERGAATRESLYQNSSDPKKRWHCATHHAELSHELAGVGARLKRGKR